MQDGFPAQNVTNNPGAAGAMRIAVRKGVFMFVSDGSIAAAQVSSPCFAVDDNTVSANDRNTGGGDTVQTRPVAGEVVALDPSGEVWVDFRHQAARTA